MATARVECDTHTHTHTHSISLPLFPPRLICILTITSYLLINLYGPILYGSIISSGSLFTVRLEPRPSDISIIAVRDSAFALAVPILRIDRGALWM